MIICIELSKEEYLDLKTLAKKHNKDVKTLFHDLITDYIDQKLYYDFSFI